jgi:hypothetical protein
MSIFPGNLQFEQKVIAELSAHIIAELGWNFIAEDHGDTFNEGDFKATLTATQYTWRNSEGWPKGLFHFVKPTHFWNPLPMVNGLPLPGYVNNAGWSQWELRAEFDIISGALPWRRVRAAAMAAIWRAIGTYTPAAPVTGSPNYEHYSILSHYAIRVEPDLTKKGKRGGIKMYFVTHWAYAG